MNVKEVRPFHHTQEQPTNVENSWWGFHHTYYQSFNHTKLGHATCTETKERKPLCVCAVIPTATRGTTRPDPSSKMTMRGRPVVSSSTLFSLVPRSPNRTQGRTGKVVSHPCALRADLRNGLTTLSRRKVKKDIVRNGRFNVHVQEKGHRGYNETRIMR